MDFLELSDKFKVSTEPMNFVLEKLEDVEDRKTKEVKQVWKNKGYFGGNLSACLKKYANESLRDSGGSNVEQLIIQLKSLEDHIDKVVKRENIPFIYEGKKEKSDE
jgi:hypothetical protein